MEIFPENTPWGQTQHWDELCPGVFMVSTASHGGIMVKHKSANTIFSPAARRCAFNWRGYACFEEDCAAAVAFRELLDNKLYSAPINEYYKPGEFSDIINRSIQNYYPSYWHAHEQRGKGKTR